MPFAVIAKCKVKRRPFPGCSFGPDIASVALDDALNNGKADSGSLEFFFGVQSMKWQEHLFSILLIEASAIVPYIKNVSFVFQK